MGLVVKALDRLQVADDDLRRVQDNVVKAFLPLSRNPLLDGNLLEGVALVGGSADNEVAHKLGRKLRGWVVLRCYAVASPEDTSLWDTQSTNPSPELTLRLRALNAMTVDLWVM
jgi:hypothetical protein